MLQVPSSGSEPSVAPSARTSEPVGIPDEPVRRESAAPGARGARAAEVDRAAGRVEDGLRLTPDEGLLLHDHADLATLGRLADLVRMRKHPEARVTYVVDRNLNPTNVCITD
jgi:hypothetical protein